MQKIVNYVLIFIAFMIAVVFFFKFDLESILWEKANFESVGQEDIEKDRAKNYTGLPAKEDIPRITSIEEWEKVINEIDYVTLTPKSIIKTDVYSLAKWESYYNKKANGTTGRRRKEVVQNPFDINAIYTPYYIIELPDGNRILAQMNQSLAKKIARGEEVELPLGRKIGFLKAAKTMLASICEKWETPTDYVLYTMNDTWQKDNATKILIEKSVISFVLFIILAVIFQLGAEKFITLEKEEN